jgi:hypothetical protein
MNKIFKIAIITAGLLLMLIADVPYLLEHDIPVPFKKEVQAVFELLVPDANAIFGVRRRTRRRVRRRTAVVVGSASYAAGAASGAAMMSHEQPAAQQQAAPAPQSAAAKAPAATGKPLPLGTVVHALPGSCTKTPVGGVEYYYCSGNFYRAVFQGNNLVYVTAKPE